MTIKTGIDLTTKKRFLDSLHQGGDAFLRHLFTPQELRQNTPEQLASIFCIKEAVMKALELSSDAWLQISTDRQANGKVQCSFLDKTIAETIASLDTSISHEGEFIVGIAVALLTD